MRTVLRKFALLLATVGLAGVPISGGAADPYTIDAILSLTGAGAFVGTTQQTALQALEGAINKSGGIAGRPIHFLIKDDQSNPQVAVQIARDMIGAHVPVILGPSLVASCSSITPLVQHDGPVLYCLTSGAHPTPGGYTFATLSSTPDLIAVGLRYFHDRGLKKIAYIVTTDASGQDAEQGIDAAASGQGLTVVDREHFSGSDISVTAQLARIKAAGPDAIVAWVTGTAAGTVLRATRDSGLGIPMLLSAGNVTPSFVRQFGQLFPNDTYIPLMLYYARNDITDAATRAAINDMKYAAATQGVLADQLFISAWDPALLVVEALKKLGASASAVQLHDSMVTLKGWVGANGPYDFIAVPQRGIGQRAVVVVRWNPSRTEFDPVSKLGGAPASR